MTSSELYDPVIKIKVYLKKEKDHLFAKEYHALMVGCFRELEDFRSFLNTTISELRIEIMNSACDSRRSK